MAERTDENEILDSWKEIAVFLRRGVRTVQRWERTEGLPVRRHGHLKRGSVYALQSDITLWVRTRQFGQTEPVDKHEVYQHRELSGYLAQHRLRMNDLNAQLKLQWAKVMSSWQQLQQTAKQANERAPLLKELNPPSRKSQAETVVLDIRRASA